MSPIPPTLAMTITNDPEPFILPPMPTSSSADLTPESPLHVLPHILLFVLLILAYFPPPFRGRAPVFLVLLALLQWQCTTSPWPPNVGEPRALRYGMSSSWIFVLPVVERMVMHTPEREFFRVEDEDDSEEMKRKKREMPREWSWRKLWRGFRLVCTPRAVGWNFGWKALNAQRAEMRRERMKGENRGLNRWEFVVGRLVRALVFYLVWDMVMLVERRVRFPEEWNWSWEREDLERTLVVEVLMLLTVYCGMNMQFDVAAAVGVGLGFNEVEEWPPLFGSIFDCYITANVWGKFWHQYIRQPCLGFSRYFVEVLHIPRRSSLAYLIHLTNAFLISTFFHVLSVGTVAGGYYPLRNLIADMSIFFMLQPVGAMIEGTVMALFCRFIWAPAKEGQDLTKRNKFVDMLMPAFCQLLGYAWVICWFFFTSFWFVRAYAGVRMQDWKLPYSILGHLLDIPDL